MITSIPELSALLFAHEKEAKKCNILLSVNIENKLEKLPLSLYDLNKLLGNLLSNAIEAAKNTNDRLVSLTIRKRAEILYLLIENSGTINDGFKESMFLPNKTTKVSINDHGYGLYIARKIVTQVQGNIEFSMTSNSVICRVEIPLN